MTVDWLSPPLRSGVVELNPGDVDLRGYRGDTFATRVRFRFADGAPMHVVGTWRAQLRATPSTTAVLDSFAVVVGPTEEGYVDLTLTAAQTTDLPQRTVWDLENVLSPTETRTWLRGGLYLDGDVTR